MKSVIASLTDGYDVYLDAVGEVVEHTGVIAEEIAYKADSGIFNAEINVRLL